MDSRLVFAVLFVTLSLMSAGTNGQSGVFNTTDLDTPLSRAACRITEFCAAEPSSCNPSTASCFFLSAKQSIGGYFVFGLSGESDGYIALTLSPDPTLGGNDTTYICAKNSSAVQFFGALYDNNELTVTTVNANSVKGKVTGKTIQCTFNATVPISTTKAPQTTIAVSTGTYNTTSGALGNLVQKIRGFVSDLGNPQTNFTNLLAANTTATTSHAITFQQSLTQAVLMTVGVLSLATF